MSLCWGCKPVSNSTALDCITRWHHWIRQGSGRLIHDSFKAGSCKRTLARRVTMTAVKRDGWVRGGDQRLLGLLKKRCFPSLAHSRAAGTHRSSPWLMSCTSSYFSSSVTRDIQVCCFVIQFACLLCIVTGLNGFPALTSWPCRWFHEISFETIMLLFMTLIIFCLQRQPLHQNWIPSLRFRNL